MIIADEDDAQRIKDPPVTNPTIRYPERVAGRHPCSPLPDYETSQALTYNNLNDSTSTLYKPPARRRFLRWKVALVSFVVYILVTLAVGIPIILRNKGVEDVKYIYNAVAYAPPWTVKNTASYLIPTFVSDNPTSPTSFGVVPVCNNWTVVVNPEGTTIVQAWAEYIVSSTGQFAFISNASYSSGWGNVLGELYVGINPDQTALNTTLSIGMQTSSSGVFDQTYVCSAIADNTTDVLLYVPDNLSSQDNILFNITVLFPQVSAPSEVKTFGTSLPLFYQHFGPLSDYVTFKEVSIGGPISAIMVDSLAACDVFVETSLQPITGEFRATRSLSLSTVLAPINANITLYNDPQSAFPTFLHLNTGNSDLTAMLTVMAPNNAPLLRPNFVASMRTFNGTLNATIVHDSSSPPTQINMHAVNELGPLNLVLDEKYQGIFQVSTKQAVASVIQGNAESQDPWAPGLSRNITTAFNSTARVDGWIGWGPQCGYLEAAQQGEITADTSLADAMLYFKG